MKEPSIGIRRRIGRRDFTNAREAVFGARGGGIWLVFNEYEIHDDLITASPKLIRGLQRGFTEEDDEGFTFFDPLYDAPDLFLKFARLYEEEDFDQAALDFACRYGLPDGEDTLPGEDGIGIQVEPERLKLSRFREESRRAWITLSLYEAVLNGDVATVIKLFKDRDDTEPFEEWSEIHSWVPDSDPHYRNFTLGMGFRCAADSVERVVQTLCRQEMVFEMVPEEQPGPSSFAGTQWIFDNLLGAMYLQMYWLFLSGSNLTRCENCGSPIPLNKSHPTHRKPPRHKRFCNDACRQAAHRSKKLDDS